MYREVAAGFAAAGRLEPAVAIAVGASNPGHPNCSASPNACPFPSYSSFDEPAVEVFAGSSMGVLPNDAADSHFSSPRVFLYKKRARLDSSPTLSYSFASDTSVHSTDATTSRRRKRFPHRCQGKNRHMSQVAPPYPEVLQSGWVEAEEY